MKSVPILEILSSNICPYQEYLSCYWPDFDQTLKVGSWDYLEQISTIAVTFFQATLVQATFGPGNICPYQEYLSCYWPIFDQTLKVGSWDADYHMDICPGIEISTTQDKKNKNNNKKATSK